MAEVLVESKDYVNLFFLVFAAYFWKDRVLLS